MEDVSCWLAKFKECSYSSRLLTKLLLLNKTFANQIDITEIKKAIYYAKKYHGEQKRQSGEPYYSHPIEVAFMIADYAVVEHKCYFRTDLFVSAILHDTIEDTELTKEIIENIFGAIVASQVESLTRIKVHGKISSEELVGSLSLQENKDVLMIKMFDRLHNVQTIGAKSPEKIQKIINETIRVFLWLSVYLEMPQIKNILIKYCYTHLHKEQRYFLTNHSLTFSTGSYQLPFLKSQNDVNPVDILQQ